MKFIAPVVLLTDVVLFVWKGLPGIESVGVAVFIVTVDAVVEQLELVLTAIISVTNESALGSMALLLCE
jgi:hypothetical protein